jgi:hypothetical protein
MEGWIPEFSNANAAVRKNLQAFKVCSTELKSLFRGTPTCLADVTIEIGSLYNVRLHVIFFDCFEYKSILLFARENLNAHSLLCDSQMLIKLCMPYSDVAIKVISSA